MYLNRFPKRKFGCTERSFRPQWCDQFPWLHYNVEIDSAFCYLCMKASAEGKFLTSSKREQTFISVGFTWWKDATIAFRKHQSSTCHKEATEAIITLPKLMKCGIGEAISSKIKEEVAISRKMLLVILQNLRYLARQGLPLRGSDGDVDSNFIQLLLLRALDIPGVSDWMKKKTNKYTSPQIQNECLEIMALQIVRKIGTIIRDCSYYVIMADECTDVSNKEQFTICIRCVDDDLNDHEYFIGLYEVSNITSDTLVHAIKDTLIRFNFNISDCRGQCYDGASNMRGVKNGVATQILAEEECAIYTHCYGHSLNLAIGSTMKESKVCCETLETAFEITKLVKFSPKRDAEFSKISSAMEEDAKVGLRKFCPTRWTVRGESINSIIQNYNVLRELWDRCLESKLQPDVKGRIIGVQTQMSRYKFLFGLKLSERILMITDNLSKTLQNESMSAAEGQVIAKLTIKTLEKMRSEDNFKMFFQLVETLRVSTDTEEPCLPRRKRAPSHIEVGEGVGYHAASTEEHFRTQYYEALDLAIAGIKDRFDQPGYEIYRNLEELLLKSANRKDYSTELKEVVKQYKNDFDELELTTQLQIFGDNFESLVTLKEAISFLKSLSAGQKMFFKQVCRLAKLIIVMPSTNAASERSFSAMKRVKSYLRNTMGQARLNHLMILNMYKDIFMSLDLNSTAKEFVAGNEHRSSVFGKFE